MKKLENQMNKLYAKIKEFELSKDEIYEINIRGFLYRVGRLNILQITAFLTLTGIQKGLTEEDIYNLLKA